METQNKLKNIHVVAGIVFNDTGQVLLAKRPLTKSLGGLWEFPGGKLEHSETPFEALKRELCEEIGINMTAAKPFIIIDHRYPECQVHLEVLLVSDYSGIPFGREQQELSWVDICDLPQYQFPEANDVIVEKLLKYID